MNVRVGVKKLTAPSPQPKPQPTSSLAKPNPTQPNPTLFGAQATQTLFIFKCERRFEMWNMWDSRLKGLMRFEVQGSRIAIFEMWDLRLGMWGALKKCVRFEMWNEKGWDSRFEIRYLRCKVRSVRFDVGCWMLDVGRCSMFDIR